jgi:hypothetical protein
LDNIEGVTVFLCNCYMMGKEVNMLSDNNGPILQQVATCVRISKGNAWRASFC